MTALPQMNWASKEVTTVVDVVNRPDRKYEWIANYFAINFGPGKKKSMVEGKTYILPGEQIT